MAIRRLLASALFTLVGVICLSDIGCDEADQPVRVRFPGGIFAFADSQSCTGEDTGGFSVLVSRTAGEAEAAVWIVARELTATRKLDFDFDSLWVEFAPGVLETTLVIAVAQDALPESAEEFWVLLRDPSAGSHLGDPSTVRLVILDDDSASASKCCFMFVAETLSVSEDGGPIAIPVRREGWGEEASVWIDTADRTAQAGTDYESFSRQLVFTALDTLVQTLIVLQQDTYPEGPETFTAVLRGPSAGWGIAQPCSLIVTIRDDDICCPRDSIYFPLDTGSFWRYRHSSSYASGSYQSSYEDTATVRVLGMVSHAPGIYSHFVWDRWVGHTAFLFQGDGPVFAMIARDTLSAGEDSIGRARRATYPWKLFDEHAAVDSTVTFFEYEDPSWNLVQRYSVAYRGTRAVAVPAGSYEAAQLFEYRAFVSYCDQWVSAVEEYSVVPGVGLVRVLRRASGVGGSGEGYWSGDTFDLISCYAGP